MSNDLPSLSPNEALAALRWQAEMGADEAISEQGVDHAASVLSTGPAIAAVSAMPGPARAHEARGLATQASSLQELQAILNDFDIGLKKTATQMVFADGVAGSDIMLIGEAPGRDEDIQGKPFVGRSGKLLDKMLAAIGRDRTNVYISNIILWRPPGNRTPTPQEISLLLPFVQRHIALAKPKVLVFLGGVAAQALTGATEGIMKLRGRWLTYADDDLELPALPTFHPAYLLRNPIAKRQAWQDFLQIKEKLSSL